MECPLLVPFDSQSLLEASKDNTFKIISWKRYLFQSKMFSDNPSITSLTPLMYIFNIGSRLDWHSVLHSDHTATVHQK